MYIACVACDAGSQPSQLTSGTGWLWQGWPCTTMPLRCACAAAAAALPLPPPGPLVRLHICRITVSISFKHRHSGMLCLNLGCCLRYRCFCRAINHRLVYLSSCSCLPLPCHTFRRLQRPCSAAPDLQHVFPRRQLPARRCSRRLAVALTVTAARRGCHAAVLALRVRAAAAAVVVGWSQGVPPLARRGCQQRQEGMEGYTVDCRGVAKGEGQREVRAVRVAAQSARSPSHRCCSWAEPLQTTASPPLPLARTRVVCGRELCRLAAIPQVKQPHHAVLAACGAGGQGAGRQARAPVRDKLARVGHARHARRCRHNPNQTRALQKETPVARWRPQGSTSKAMRWLVLPLGRCIVYTTPGGREEQLGGGMPAG